MTVKLMTEEHLEFLSLTRGCIDSFVSTLVKRSHCWNSHVAAHIWSVTKLNYDSNKSQCSSMYKTQFLVETSYAYNSAYLDKTPHIAVSV